MSISVFRKCVEDEFRFLIDDHGFAIEPTAHADSISLGDLGERLLYVSDHVKVEISHSPHGEIAVTIDENPPSYRFGFDLYLSAYHPGVLKTLGDEMAYSEENVRKQLKNIANALNQYGKSLLYHDREVFERMRTYKWWEDSRG